MKITLIKELENRTAHFHSKFTTSEVERCKNEGLQFQADDLTMFRGTGNKILITDLYDTVQFSEEGDRGQQTNLPIFAGKLEGAEDIDVELDDALSTLNQKVGDAFQLEVSGIKYSVSGEVKLETRNFRIVFDPMYKWVTVYRRNLALEERILPLTSCPFNFYDIHQVLCNHIGLNREGYTLLYTGKKKLIIFGHGKNFEIDPEEL